MRGIPHSIDFSSCLYSNGDRDMDRFGKAVASASRTLIKFQLVIITNPNIKFWLDSANTEVIQLRKQVNNSM